MHPVTARYGLAPKGMPLEETIRPEVTRKNIERWVEIHTLKP